MHGPHQSEPEKFNKINRCSVAAVVVASLKLVSHPLDDNNNELNKISNNDFIKAGCQFTI